MLFFSGVTGPRSSSCGYNLLTWYPSWDCWFSNDFTDVNHPTAGALRNPISEVVKIIPREPANLPRNSKGRVVFCWNPKRAFDWVTNLKNIPTHVYVYVYIYIYTYQGSLHYTPEHCLVNGEEAMFPFTLVLKKPCFQRGRCSLEGALRMYTCTFPQASSASPARRGQRPGGRPPDGHWWLVI